MRLLLVEDNRQLAEWLSRTLQQDRYAVECAYDGDDANYRLHTQTYDLVILDLALPKMQGEEVLRRLRARDDNVPVLILTARDTMQGRISGLDSGADDYMAKPFEVAELEARIRVLLRRSANHKNPVLRCGNLSFDSNTRQFSVSQATLALTPREHTLLEALMMKPGKTVSKQALAESLFTLDETVSPEAIEIYVHRLRKKLHDSDAAIITLRGLGYLLKSHGI
ncbi:MAG: hypothetical protein RLZZ401_956 [Pseudomonadota bacterium]|jgi:two-component system response regulator TctD